MLKRIFTTQIDAKDINEADSTLTAYVSTLDRDRMDEVVDPKGVDLRQFKKNPVVLWAHDYTSPPVAKALWVKADDKGIISKMKFADTEFAQDIFKMFKDGFLKAFSIGFMPKEWVDGDGKKNTPRRTFTKTELLEYSAVPVPANPEALALAMQKGLFHDGVKEFFEAAKPEEDTKTEDRKPEDNEEYCTNPDCECEGKGIIGHMKLNLTGLEDITAENVLLTQENDQLKQDNKRLIEQNTELRMNKETIKQPDEKTFSEMTGDEIAKMFSECMTGVIRKHTGRVS